MRTACFTVDMDRDVNFLSDGKVLSKDRGNGTSPRFGSSAKGTSLLLELLDEIGIEATFFAEAVTLRETGLGRTFSGHEVASHGLEHEDISQTIQTFGKENAAKILAEASDVIEDCTGQRPKGYRAPFMSSHPQMHEVLANVDMVYDSSLYCELGSNMHPYRIDSIVEFPVPKGYDRDGKRIAAYLWPMHEGKRGPDDYVNMAKSMDDGTFTIATHTWHMTESIDRGVMDGEEMKRNVLNVRTILEAFLDLGYKFMTMDALAQKCERPL